MRDDLIRVLLVDDDSADAEITGRPARSVGHPRFEVERAASLADAAERIQSGHFSVALLDLGLPDSPRGETLERFRSNCSLELPVIVLHGN